MAETLAARTGDRKIEYKTQQHAAIACRPRGTTPARARSGLEPPYYRIASMDPFRLHFGLPRPHTNVREKSWDRWRQGCRLECVREGRLQYVVARLFVGGAVR
jgi:hypothetical protein